MAGDSRVDKAHRIDAVTVDLFGTKTSLMRDFYVYLESIVELNVLLILAGRPSPRRCVVFQEGILRTTLTKVGHYINVSHLALSYVALRMVALGLI